MKTNVKTILFSGFAVIATAISFTLSFENSSLESLRANAATKCVEASNSDCRSSSTGNIYTGYKAQTVGGTSISLESNLESND